MQSYDGTQPRLEGWDKFMHDSYENDFVGLLLEIDAGRPVIQMPIGEVRSTWEEGDMTEAAYYIDFLADVLGIEPYSWTRRFRRLEQSGQAEPVHQRSRMTRFARGRSIGQYLTDVAYDALPIEQDEDGSGWVEIDLITEGEHSLLLRADGSFETIYALRDDEESELIYGIRFTADIMPVSHNSA